MEPRDDQATIADNFDSVEDSEKQVVKETVQGPSFPEGGLDAWRTLLGAVLAQFSTFGYINSFGAYQDYYVRFYLTHYSSSAIGWIGSIQLLFVLSMGIVTGKLFDKGYLHHLVLAGTLIFSFALFMLSLSHENQYYQVFLSQGLLGGIGCGLIYVPALGIASHYFHRKRAAAMGIVAAGASIGAVAHPIMLNELFHGRLGFHNGVRASAGMNLGILLIANFLMKPRLPPKKDAPPVHVVEFARDSAYVFSLLGGFCAVIAMFFPIFFIQLFAVKHGINRNLAFFSTSILNGSSAVGRVVPGFLAIRLGVYNVLLFITAGIIAVLWSMLAVHDIPGLVIFAIFAGFFTGAGVSLLAPAVASLARDFNEIGARLGICFAFGGIAGLVGTPIAGALLTNEYIWWRGIVFVGIMMSLAFLWFFIARQIIARRKKTQFV